MKSITRKIISLILCLVLAFATAVTVYAEGSAQTSQFQVNGASNTARRAFTEWTNAFTAGIVRQQVIYVYAFAGETLNFGSSMYKSKLNIDSAGESYATNAETGVDIAIIDKYKNITTYDVIKDGKGFIGTRAKETAGPVTVNSAGYDPYTLVAPYDGVYEFHFHSYTNTNESPNANTLLSNDSGAVSNQFAANGSKGGTVAMWDVTVVGTDKETVKTGRAYTNYLSLNIGSNQCRLCSQVYALTDDGYIYDIYLNSFDPWGFILFANNRGLTSAANDSPIYHSVATNDNTMGTLYSLFNTTFHSPSSVNTGVDKTYKLFFQKPNNDLVGTSVYPKVAKAPSPATNLKFYGWKGIEGVTNYGHGGYFTFDITNASSATIKLDMTTIGGGVVELSNSVVEGKNTIEWDGKDANGNFLDANKYTLNDVVITLQTKAGEIHFPFFDVEGIYGGIKITRINDIYDSTGKNVIAECDPSNAADVSARSIVYYNNTPLANGKLSADQESAEVVQLTNKSPYVFGYDTGNGSYSYAYSQNTLDSAAAKYVFKTNFSYSGISWTNIDVNTSNKTEGIDSSTQNACYVEYNSNHETSGNNMCATDVWAFYTAESTSVQNTCAIEVVSGAITTGAVTGFVFYDANNNGKYLGTYTENDYPLNDVSVSLLNSSGETIANTTTDAFGKYRFYNVTPGNYTVSVTKPQASYNCTTKNPTQSVTVLANQVASATDVGYFYITDNTKVKVTKHWNNANGQTENAVVVKLFGKYKAADGTVNIIDSGYSASLSDSNSWTTTFSNMPKYFVDANNYNRVLQYFIKEYYVNSQTGTLDLVGTSLSSATDFDTSYENRSDDTSEYVSSYFYTTVSSTETAIDITNTAKTVTGTVNANVKYIRTNSASPLADDFYVALYTKDTETGKYVLESSVKKLNVSSDVAVGSTVSFGNVPFGKYYIFEVDENGTILTDSEYYSEYKVIYPENYELEVTAENNNQTLHIENYDDYKIIFVSNRATDKTDDIFDFVWASDLEGLANPNPLTAVEGEPTADNSSFLGWSSSKTATTPNLYIGDDYTLPGQDTYYYGIWGAKGTFSYYTEIRYAEPWGLRLSALLKCNGTYIDKSKYTNYGVYVYNLDQKAAAPSKAQMIEKGTYYAKGSSIESSQKINGLNGVAFDYAKQIYTYQMNNDIYVMFYAKYNGIEYYGSIKNRNLLNSYQSIVDKGSVGNSSFNSNQQKLSSSIVNMYSAVKENGSTSSADYPVSAKPESSMFTNIVSDNTYNFRCSIGIRSYEPWGLKASVTATKNGSPVNFSSAEDVGIITYHNTDNAYQGNMTVNDIISDPDSQIYSKLNENLTINSNSFIMHYAEGVYTYQLNADFLMAFFIKVDGVYYFSSISQENLLSAADSYKNMFEQDEPTYGLINAMQTLFRETYYYKFGAYPEGY